MKVWQATTVEWEPVRPEITTGILGKTLYAQGVRVVLTRVAPGGKFKLHSDKYGHLMYFISGQGTITVAGEQFAAGPGVVAQIDPGELHAYENTGADDLVLISLNLPAATTSAG